jgi:hypothetical protein
MAASIDPVARALANNPEIALALPYRGTFGEPRPAALCGLPLPPARMPGRHSLRPLKAWRYVGVFGPELMLCLASVRIGPVRQSFWAVWDRAAGRLYERTAPGPGGVRLMRGGATVIDRTLRLDLRLEETAGVETVCRSAHSYAWTRKQGGIRASGTIELDGARRPFDARAVVDDTAGYHQRHTSWCWSAGVGVDRNASAVAWNLVSGVNDPPGSSERTVWIDGRPVEVASSAFAKDLSSVDALQFSAEAARERHENRLLVRSSYRQPFGTFSGELPGGVALAEGYGVMEEHDVWW